MTDGDHCQVNLNLIKKKQKRNVESCCEKRFHKRKSSTCKKRCQGKHSIGTFKIATLPKTFAATASIITLVNTSVWHPPSPQDTKRSLWFLNNVTHSEVGLGEL